MSRVTSIAGGVSEAFHRRSTRATDLCRTYLHCLDGGSQLAVPARAVPGGSDASRAGSSNRLIGTREVPLQRLDGASIVMSLQEALRRRVSSRSFTGASMPYGTLSALLTLSAGETGGTMATGYARRAYPSGGGLYPIETYVVVRHVDALAEGVYHYCAGRECLDELTRGRVELTNFFGASQKASSASDEMLYRASVVLVLVADMARSMLKYGERAWKLALLEAGHIGQNVYLAAAALRGVGVCAMGGFNGPALTRTLSLDSNRETILYPLIVGVVAERQLVEAREDLVDFRQGWHRGQV